MDYLSGPLNRGEGASVQNGARYGAGSAWGDALRTSALAWQKLAGKDRMVDLHEACNRLEETALGVLCKLKHATSRALVPNFCLQQWLT